MSEAPVPTMLRLDNLLVQQPPVDGPCLVFAFRGKRWSLYTSLIALLLLATTYLLAAPLAAGHPLLVPGGYLMAALFAWSAFYSYHTSRTLTVDSAARTVRYRTASPFGQTDRSLAFADFADVRLWRPGRRSFVVVVLRLKADGQEIPLGTSEAGCFGLPPAAALAENLATRLGLPVIREETV